MRLSHTVLRTSVAYRSSRPRLFRNLVLWLCVMMVALQPLETLAAVQQRGSSPAVEQRRVSADSAEKGWTAALRDQSQAPAGLVSAALFGALPTPIGTGGSNSVSTALAHLERLQQVNPTPNRFVGSAGDTESDGVSWGGFGGGGAPVGSPALALLLPQTSDPEPANQLPGPYTYASHRPMQGSGGTSALPGANPGRFAAWLLGLEANEDLGGLAGLGQAIVRVFLYVVCVLDGECLASLTELQGLADELGSAAQESLRWTGKLLSRAAERWPLLPMAQLPLADLISFGLGRVPVVGDIYDLLTGITGFDVITGERFTGWQQAVMIGAALLPFVSGKDLRFGAKALQWSDDVRVLFRTGIWGGTMRRIGRALPEGVTIGVRGRPVMAALWEGIYLRTGKFVPKPSLTEATEVAWKVFGTDFSRVAEFSGLRRMKNVETGMEFFAHSDIDLQFIVNNGRSMTPKAAESFVRILNESIGTRLLRHTDNYNGLLIGADGATFLRQDKMTHIINSSGYQGSKWGMEAFAQFVSDGQWPWIGQVLGGHHLPSNYPSP